jgi:glycosyltransferase involved in cell wall biosynthesis/LmbE family N-acetylglucosaminyl deacetylase
MVVVAHPDDEVIGVGAHLAQWGASVIMVHATDGAPPDDGDAIAAGFSSRDEYARARRDELRAALSHLPVPPRAMLRLGQTDQRVTHQLTAVVDALHDLVATWSPDVVITHAYEGGHPDHDALAVAVAAVRHRGLPFEHLEFAEYHAREDGTLATNRFAKQQGATRMVPDPEQRRLKRRMLDQFRSQQRTLAAFGVDEEWLRHAPEYDFSCLPDTGRLWYERFDWAMRGAEWRDRVHRSREQLNGHRRSPRLSVLNVAYPFAPVGRDAVGGAEQVVAQIDRALVAAEHRSLVIARRGSDVAGELVELAAPQEPFNDDTLRRGRTECAQAIAETLKREPIDIVHLHGVDCDEYLPDASLPIVVTLHLWPDRHPPAVVAGARPDMHLVCVSEAQRAACGKTTRTSTIRNGVQLRELLPDLDRAHEYVLLLGRISPEKGFHLAVDAARRNGLPVVIAGALFPYRSHREYFDHVLAPRLSEHVRFVGAVGFEEKRHLLAGARCLAVPTILPETSSLAAMEAFACGTPVVALRSPALAELIEDGRTGFLVDTVDEMAEAMARVDRLDRAACRYAAEARCDGRVTVSGYLQLYRELARSSRRPGVRASATSV